VELKPCEVLTFPAFFLSMFLFCAVLPCY
jgi:hypothetical protein